MKKLGAFFAVCFISTSSIAADYTVDYTHSSIAFSARHAGNAFSGTFGKWNAKISFDAANLAASKLDVTIDTASAATGNKMYDGTLLTEDWFSTKVFPQAHFVSTSITKNETGGYTAAGNLTIRDVTKPVTFDFTLTPANAPGPQVSALATLKLDRLAYNVGAKSDAKAEWVDREIKLDISVTATHP